LNTTHTSSRSSKVSGWLSHARLRRFALPLTVIWIVYWVILFGLTHSPKLPRIPIRLDRRMLIAHGIAFALLAFLGVIARKARSPDLTFGWKMKWFWIYAVYAAADEILQPLSHRHADVYDWIVDVAGVAVVFALFGSAPSPSENS